MLYQLMNKDRVVATFEESEELDDFSYRMVEQFDSYLPYGFTSMDEWIDDRQIARHRTSIRKLMQELGMNNRRGFINMVRCVSLTDTFWMKRADSELAWQDVSLYSNVFDDTGEVLGMAPLFDQNMALLPYLIEHDDLEEYLSHQGPKIGRSFVGLARALLTSEIRAKLVTLKNFTYEAPGFGYPAWKLEVANRIKEQQIDAILA